MKVYVLASGDCDDYQVHCAYSSESVADEMAKKYSTEKHEIWVEEYDLDPGLKQSEDGIEMFRVTYEDGKLDKCDRILPWDDEGVNHACSYKGTIHSTVQLWANSEDDAIRLASGEDIFVERLVLSGVGTGFKKGDKLQLSGVGVSNEEWTVDEVAWKAGDCTVKCSRKLPFADDGVESK